MTRALIVILCSSLLTPAPATAEHRGHLDTGDLPPYLRDRGEGISTSMFGTYAQEGQLLVYPYYEYYRDHDYEYAPNELGYTQDTDYRGSYEGHEWLIFVGYGISRSLAVEVEAAAISAELETAANDNSGLPPHIEESGIGDVEGQIRWRWKEETPGGPEFYSFFETVLPTQDKGSLIGTTDWEFQLGAGLTRGRPWGTTTLRAAVEYEAAENAFGLGEFAVEYLKRLSSTWRLFGSVEGTGDEIELITEAQLHLSGSTFLKWNNSFGLTSKATDWAPEVGVVLSF
jgi:hypothetical protein